MSFIKCILMQTSVVMVLMVILNSSPEASISNRISYQGYLTQNGTPVETPQTMRFSIWSASTSGYELWYETQSGVTVTSGLFNVFLGAVTAIPDSVFSSSPRYLEVQVNGTTLPRTQLVSTPYSYRVSSIDGAIGGTVADKVDTAEIRLNSYHLSGSSWRSALLLTESNPPCFPGGCDVADTFLVMSADNDKGATVTMRNDAQVNTVSLYSQEVTGQGACMLFNDDVGNNTVILDAEDNAGEGGRLTLRSHTARSTLILDAENGVNGEAKITMRENATGNTVIEIGAGLDYSESFPLSCDVVSPGTVVAIDPDNPGKLCMSTCGYDKRVAGIVAGANELKSGVTLGPAKAAGNSAVALAGRVYCWVDGSYGAIEPGDMLTSSPTPGHAMKVADYSRAQGATIGKAMEPLPFGKKALVLVLVTLQ